MSQTPQNVTSPGMPGSQARFQCFRVGEIEAIAVSDGGIPIPPPPGVEPPLKPALRALACLVLRMPQTGKLVLIDAGFGPNAKRAGRPLPTAGRLRQSLADAGIAPGDIDIVLISHIHPDHVDGLFEEDGSRIFPNASYHAGAEEVAFWSQDELDLSQSPAPPPLKEEMIKAARRMLGFAGDTLKIFAAGEDAVPGIGTIAFPGHTPGQVGFIVESGGETLLYTADAFTTPEMSIATPDRHIPFDLDPRQAVETRYKLLRTLADEGWHGFTPHFPWPNVGQVRADGEGFAWSPATQVPAGILEASSGDRA